MFCVGTAAGNLSAMKRRCGGANEKPTVSGDGSRNGHSAKRARGRPLGSKNKPKLPVVIMQESVPSSTLHTHILEIPAGRDIAIELSTFSRGSGLGFSVLSASGPLSAATFHQQSPAPITLHDSFNLLSLSAAFLPDGVCRSMSVSLTGSQGQILGGQVAGPLVAAGTVVVVVAAFSEAVFHRVPEEDAEVSGSSSVSGSSDLGR